MFLGALFRESVHEHSLKTLLNTRILKGREILQKCETVPFEIPRYGHHIVDLRNLNLIVHTSVVAWAYPRVMTTPASFFLRAC